MGGMPPTPPSMIGPLRGPHREYLGPYIYTWATRFLNLGAQMATAYKSYFLSLDRHSIAGIIREWIMPFVSSH
jgi:hypothetical protein